jgi:hypothetical protein
MAGKVKMGARRLALARTVALLGCLSSLALAAPAQGASAPIRPFETTFPLNGEGQSKVSFDDACGVARDPLGDYYVAEYGHNAIDVYGPGVENLTQVSKVSTANGPCGLAVDGAGNIFANTYHEGVLELKPSTFPPNQATTYTSATIDSGHSTGVAVDASSGNLYVNDRTYIAKYEAPVSPGEQPAQKIGLGTLAEGYGLALSAFAATKGEIYVPDATSDTVRVYNPSVDAVNPVAEFNGAGTPQQGFRSLYDSAAAVDPSNGHLLIADNTQPGFSTSAAVIDELNSKGEYRGQLPHALVDSKPPGLTTSPGKVFVTSGNSTGSVVYAFGATNAAHRLEVKESGAGAGRVVSEPAGIACADACAAEYGSGSTVVLSAEPDTHSAVSWSGCDVQEGSKCTVTLGIDRSVSAEFEPLPQRQLTVTATGPGTVTSSPAGIQCPATCTAPFNEGSTLTLSATHSERTSFSGWSGCDSEPAPGQCKVAMSAARAVQARFTATPQRTLSVTRAGAGKGLISGNVPGLEFTAISCGETCAAEYNQGAQVTLTATAAPGSRFAGFSGCDSEAAAGQCTVALSAARLVSADFEPARRFSLSLGVGGPGQGLITSSPAGISCPAGCSAQYGEGETIILAASPAQGSTFAGWSGACSGTGTCRVILSSDTTVGASFEREAPPLGSAGPATLTLGAATSAPNGRSASLQITVPTPGTLTAKAPDIQPSTMKVGAGTSALKLALSAKGKAALGRAHRHRLAVKVVVSFTPAGSKSALTQTKTVVFQRAARKSGGETLREKGKLFASFSGAIFPRALPRNRLAPITVSLAGKVSTPAGGDGPAVRQIEIAMNSHGVLDTQGLPECRRKEIALATTAQALLACRDALIGEGSFLAHIHLGSEVSFPSSGHILAFNSKRDGHPVILAHVYGTQPVAITHILVFSIHHTKGTYGTVLSTTLAKSAANRAQIRRLSLVLHRTYTYRGKPHSYLSADCPAPKGFAGALFPLAHTKMGFTDGETLEATIIRSCGVSR